jgi:hypothetical protein
MGVEPFLHVWLLQESAKYHKFKLDKDIMATVMQWFQWQASLLITGEHLFLLCLG